MTQGYIEVKAYREAKVSSYLAEKLIKQGTIIGLITTGQITKPAKQLLDTADIVWIENFPEELLFLEEEDKPC